MLRPQAVAGAQLEDRFPGKNVETVADRDGTPPELVGRGSGVAQPITFTVALHWGERFVRVSYAAQTAAYP
jgi:hypothetical protein